MPPAICHVRSARFSAACQRPTRRVELAAIYLLAQNDVIVLSFGLASCEIE